MPTLAERDFYARREIEVRTLAKTTKDPELKKTLEAMAESYSKLVEESDKISELRRKAKVAL